MRASPPSVLSALRITERHFAGGVGRDGVKLDFIRAAPDIAQQGRVALAADDAFIGVRSLVFVQQPGGHLFVAVVQREVGDNGPFGQWKQIRAFLSAVSVIAPGLGHFGLRDAARDAGIDVNRFHCQNLLDGRQPDGRAGPERGAWPDGANRVNYLVQGPAQFGHLRDLGLGGIKERRSHQ